jgi:hypothetical protein
MTNGIVLSVLAAVAKQERITLSERTVAGLQRARRAGKRLGRRAVQVDVKTTHRLRAEGLGVRGIAKKLGISCQHTSEVAEGWVSRTQVWRWSTPTSNGAPAVSARCLRASTMHSRHYRSVCLLACLRLWSSGPVNSSSGPRMRFTRPVPSYFPSQK